MQIIILSHLPYEFKILLRYWSMHDFWLESENRK